MARDFKTRPTFNGVDLALVSDVNTPIVVSDDEPTEDAIWVDTTEGATETVIEDYIAQEVEAAVNAALDQLGQHGELERAELSSLVTTSDQGNVKVPALSIRPEVPADRMVDLVVSGAMQAGAAVPAVMKLSIWRELHDGSEGAFISEFTIVATNAYQVVNFYREVRLNNPPTGFHTYVVKIRSNNGNPVNIFANNADADRTYLKAVLA